MMTNTASRWNVRWGLALLAGLTGLLLGALPAQAQEVCGDLGDMSSETLDLYLEELEDEFDVDLDDGELCTELTKNFIKACQTGVKNAVKCIQSQIKALNKQNQTLCKALAGPDADECVALFKNDSSAASDAVKAEGDTESATCEEFAAEIFFSICMFGDV